MTLKAIDWQEYIYGSTVLPDGRTHVQVSLVRANLKGPYFVMSFKTEETVTDELVLGKLNEFIRNQKFGTGTTSQ